MKPCQEVVTVIHIGKLRPLFRKSEMPTREPLDSPHASNKLIDTERQEVEPNSDGGRTQRNSENEANQDRSGRVASKSCTNPHAGGQVIGK